MPYTMRPLDIALGDQLTSLLPANTPVRAAGQDALRPTGSYVTFRVMTDEPIGMATSQMTDEEEIAGAPPLPTGRLLWASEQIRRATVEVQTIGPDAAELCARLSALYANPVAAYNATVRGCTLTAIDTPRRIPAEVVAETEDRWVLTFTCSYTRRETLAIGAIETPAQVVQTGPLCADAEE